jgi:hypothetical protein
MAVSAFRGDWAVVLARALSCAAICSEIAVKRKRICAIAVSSWSWANTGMLLTLRKPGSVSLIPHSS